MIRIEKVGPDSTALVVTGLLLILVCYLAGCSDDNPVESQIDDSTGGTIIVDISSDTLGAHWTCFHEDVEVAVGTTDTILREMPAGNYRMEWEELFDRISPAEQNTVLAVGDTITFYGFYGSSIPQPNVMGWLFDVRGTAADDVYAVGSEGTLVHFDGTAWSRIDLGIKGFITALAGTDELWACGTDGQIWRHDDQHWQPVYSGTDEYLVALGYYQGTLYVGGIGGTLRSFDGSHWQAVGTSIIIRDSYNQSHIDTLQLDRDVAAVVTISHHGIGGAYYLTDDHYDLIGTEGTQGMVLGKDSEFDWRLDPLDIGGDDAREWVVCSTSDETNPERNYLGTSAGGLFRLFDEGDGILRWVRLEIPITSGPEFGINGIWLGPGGELYMATQEGQVVYFAEGEWPRVLYTGGVALTGIWGTGHNDVWVTGLWKNQILHLSHDPQMRISITTLMNIPPVPAEN